MRQMDKAMAAADLAHAPLCLAPDGEPRPPRLALPRGACDCHAHICGPAALYPYVAQRIYTPPDATLDPYRRLLAPSGSSAPSWCSRASMARTTAPCWRR